MKTITRTTSAGPRLGLLTAIITLVGGLAANAQLGLFVNETFDPPTLPSLTGGQGGGVTEVTRAYVSEGVKGLTAAKTSATFTGADGWCTTRLYQTEAVAGNDLATPESTVLSFDLKVDQPGVAYVLVGLSSWTGYGFSGDAGFSYAFIPLGSYTPGEFRTVLLPLDDPLWHATVSGDDPPVPTPFDPTGKTIQIPVALNGWFLPTPGPISITVDNVRLSTKNFMLPWKSSSIGQVTFTSPNTAIATEVGWATYLGEYTSVMTLSVSLPGSAVGTYELTAANGDKLSGFMGFLSETEAAFAIEGGTGRFEGVKGTYIAEITWSEFPVSFTAKATGAITGLDSRP